MGEVVFVRVLALAVAVNLIYIVSAKAQCDAGWFGNYCQYQCHCADSSPCDQVDGSCGSGCHSDWFGPACQYKSIELLIYPKLVDKNDGTCKYVRDTPYIYLQPPIPLTWIRLVFGNADYPKQTKLYYYLEGDTRTPQECQTLSFATVNEKTLDIVCHTNRSVKKFFIRFPSDTSLCSVYVSGGRNLALRQPAEQSSIYSGDGNNNYYWLASNAVDGTPISDTVTVDVKSTCTHTDLDKAEGWWKVTLSTPGNISSILIYNRESHLERLKGFRLQASSDIGAAGNIRVYGPNETVSSTYEWVPSPQIEFPVKQVLVEKGSTSEILTLCEVLVFGETACPTTTFGLDCLGTCNCYDDKEKCFVHSGGCPSGCVFGYTGENCSACKPGKYGDRCKQTCHNCVSNGSICSNTYGTCFYGCKPGYTGDKCENECASGSYGIKCQTSCSEHCAGESNSCNHVTGSCELGCDPGYRRPLCTQECNSGYYGDECKTPCSEHCAGESNSCNHVNGTCELGCDPGYQGPLCTQECMEFTWGKDCAQNCSSKCQNNTCHHVKGTCGACVPGYWGDFCEKVCNATTYGPNCTETCDNNCLSGLCNHVTGKCHACPTGRTGEFCQEAKQLENSSFGDAVKDFHMWIILTFVAVLLLVVSFAVIVLYRRRSQRKTVARAVAPNHEENRVELDRIPERSVISDDPLPSTSAGTGSNKRNIFSRVQLSLNLSLGGTFFGNECDSNESTAGASGVNADPSQTGNTAIPVKELKNYILKHAADSHLEEEFLSVPKTSGSPQTVAGLPENAKKNRYKNIIPYDATRVQLETVAGKKNSDYINASYIKDHRSNRAFIASQGPTDAILDDFVRMLWEQRVEKVVMLTNLTEEGKKKCCMYWPQDGEKQFGGVSVKLLTTHVFAEYTIRNLCLAKRGQASRHLTQFHFTAWPDQSVPGSPWGLVDLYQRVTAEEDNGPVLVHCSAGVGRTGTFIGLCNLLQEAEATGTMDFRSTLWKLRQDRMHAIQTLEQYSYLHRVALVGFMVAGTTIKEADMNCRLFSLESEKGGTKSTRNYSQEYQALVEVCDATTSHQADYLSEEQRKPVYQNLRDSRDRLSNILPKPSFRVKLVAEISREDTYINAVFVPNLSKNLQDILTQLPLPSTVTDFWRLVHQCDVGLIVAFDTDLKDGDETIGDFLPKSETEAFENERFLVKANTRVERRLATEYSLSVQHKVLPDSDTAITQTKSVTLVLCKTIPIDPSSVFELLEQIEACKPMNRRRTVYMCRNGADKCGLMCIQSILLERMRLDQCLTVPLVVGKIKAIRPQVIPTVEHYKCLYRVLKLEHDSQNEYGNIGALAGASSP